LDDPLPKLCPVIPTSNQDGRQAKNRKKGRWNLKKVFSSQTTGQSQPNFAEMILGWFPSKIVSGISNLRPRWPPQPNLILHRTEGRTHICQLKDLILTLLDLMFRRICIYQRLKSSQRMNLCNVGSDTSVNDSVQTNKKDK
jgi:hypothetical protein